ncbi:uncharacterized protein LOC127379479 [Dicentrarchus labrax]|uniref:uncharacterized protein LOC127379479 n=1 Tax=Dicentrarchus labrax TaxID=13489 RepID=UPI0021F523A1|nr:uncharacterized protein LOC127379479 [Dicentrarchus labrax]
MMETNTTNYVAELNEYAQRTRSALYYEDRGSVRPDHDKTFTQRAVLDGKVYPDGVGKTKKEAKQSAAKNALKCLLENGHQDPSDSTKNAAKAPAAPVHQTSTSDINYICWLNEYGQKNRVSIKAVESLGANNVTPCCSFVVGGKEYPVVTGETKREAKEEAAKLVYDVIHGSKMAKTADEKSIHASNKEKEEFNLSDISNKTRSLSVSSDNSFTETNYIGIVNHYCQKTSSSHKFIEERRYGPSHNLQFFYKLVINNKDYPVGEGQSIKEAKQNAARLAWSALQEQSDWDSKVSFRSTVSEDGAPPVLSARSPTLESHESSSQSMSASTGSSIIFADTSNPSQAQMSFRSTASEDDAQSRESHSLSQSAPTSSGVFTDSSNSSSDQSAAQNNNMGNVKNETPAQSRFTSDFDPLKRLGNGAFGVVYKVRQKLLKKDYAVKIVLCEENCLREVGTLSELLHPNIVRYYTFWMEDSKYQDTKNLPRRGDISADSYTSSQSTDNSSSSSKYLYIQMELCDTKTLRVWIDEKNTQPLADSKRREESLDIAQQIVSGVEYIHSKKHIHRDLKPANILFGLDGAVKIGDFGLVTRDNDDERTVNRGTPLYMAPEQNKENYDRKVDIFPLGLIYLELLWKVSTVHERVDFLHKARCQRFPKEFSLTFAKEEKIIKSMLSEKPEDRPEASELKAELEKWAQMFNTQKMCQENVTIFKMHMNRKPNECPGTTRPERKHEEVCSEGPGLKKRSPFMPLRNVQGFPIGVGKNTDSKHSAAKNAPKGLKENENPGSVTEIAAEIATAPVQQQSVTKPVNVSKLNENVQENRTLGPASLGPNNSSSIVVGDQEPAAKKETKEEAARPVYHDELGSEATELFSGLAVSDDVAPTWKSTSRDSPDSKSKSLATTSSDSVVFTNSSNSVKDQDQNPVVNPKSSNASNVQKARRNNNEDVMSPGKMNTGNSPSEKTSIQLEISRFKSEFDCKEPLGKGAFGCVFKAKEKLTEKNFAIKIVLYKKKSLQEVKALTDLHHPNIVRYYTCWLEDSGYQWDDAADSWSSSQSSVDSLSARYLYIQMELCDSKTLKDWIDEKNTQRVTKSLRDLRREESLIIIIQIVSGVEYIHSMKLIHRDLKPANIMFGKDRNVKIGDFGLVTDENDADPEKKMKRTVGKGTPFYMAPEQKDETTYDRKVDIFAVGLINVELLCNFRTVHERHELWDDIRRQKFPQGFSDHFPEECIILCPMLCEKPDNRPEASKVKKDLEEYTRRNKNERRGSQSV